MDREAWMGRRTVDGQMAGQWMDGWLVDGQWTDDRWTGGQMDEWAWMDG